MQRQERECVCVQKVAPLRGENEEERERERDRKEVEYEGMFHLNFQLAVSVFRLY